VVDALDRAPGWVETYTFAACAAAEAAWLLGSAAHAPILERNVRAKVVAPDFRWPMMDGRLGLARLCALQHRVDEAAEWFAQARLLLEEQGARPLRAIVDFDEATMWLRQSDPDQRIRADALLAAARAQFRALEMTGWIRRAEALGGDVDAPEAHLRPRSAPRSTPTQEAAVFRSFGDYWMITFEGQVVQLRATRGFQYLAELLRHPGREIHASDLVETKHAAVPAVRDVFDIKRGLGDAGVLLDGRARAEYRTRLAELREDLEDAERMNDIGRMASARDEVEALLQQLATAGRGRKAASHAERARIAATKAIKAALDKIAAAHPLLGRHLAATIRRGYFCVYLPDPRRPIVWEP
jgi:hypothetical protein